MTPGDLARVADIRARADAATEGPWVRRGKWIDGGADGYDGVIEPDDVDCSSYCYGGSSRIEIADSDAAFIAAARADVPWLLDRLAAETAEVERLRQELDDVLESRREQASWPDRDGWLRDQHARYHAEDGNMLGRDECGWERCGFWDAAEWTLNAPKPETARLAAETERADKWYQRATEERRARLTETERADVAEAAVAHYQGVLIATCAEKAEVQRREAEMRERIEALCDETRNWHVYPTRDAGDCFGFDTVNDFVVDLRAALSPAEEPK